MINDPFGSPRRRRQWVLPLILIVLLGGAIGLSQVATPTSPLLTEDLRSQMLDVSRRAGVFQDMVTRMGAVDRVELSTIADEVMATLGETRDELAGMESPPPAVAGVLAVLDLAIESWETGVAGLREHLLTAADGDESLGLSDRVLDDLLELRAGDRLYRRAVEALAAADVTQPVSPMPEVAFLPAAYPVAPAAQTLVAQARAVGSPLALHAQLAIEQVTTVPEWVLDTEDTLVLDVTDTLVVRVVVTNAGNAPSEATGLTVELAGGDGSSQQGSMAVPAMAAGEKTTVTVDPLSVTPGRTYSLVVRLDLTPGEAETLDNSRTLRFRVNEGTATTAGETG